MAVAEWLQVPSKKESQSIELSVEDFSFTEKVSLMKLLRTYIKQSEKQPSEKSLLKDMRKMKVETRADKRQFIKKIQDLFDRLNEYFPIQDEQKEEVLKKVVSSLFKTNKKLDTFMSVFTQRLDLSQKNIDAFNEKLRAFAREPRPRDEDILSYYAKESYVRKMQRILVSDVDQAEQIINYFRERVYGDPIRGDILNSFVGQAEEFLKPPDWFETEDKKLIPKTQEKQLDLESKIQASLLEEFATVPDADKEAMAFEVLATLGVDYFLTHIEELRLSDEAVANTLELVAHDDPEAFIFYLERSGLEIFDNKEQVLQILVDHAPFAAAYVLELESLHIRKDARVGFYEQIAEKNPLEFIEVFPAIMAKNRFSVKQIARFDEVLVQSVEQLDLSPDESIKQFEGIRIPTFPRVNSLLRMQRQESLDAVVRAYVPEIKQYIEEQVAKEERGWEIMRDVQKKLEHELTARGLDFVKESVAVLLSLYVEAEFPAGYYNEKNLWGLTDHWLTNYDLGKVVTVETRTLFVEYLLDKEEKGIGLFFKLSADLAFDPQTEYEHALMQKLFDWETQKGDEDVSYALLKFWGSLTGENKKRYEDQFVALVRLVASEAIYICCKESSFLSNKIKFAMFETAAETVPYEVADTYYRNRITNKRLEKQLFKKLQKDGIAPFSLVLNTDTLIRAISTGAYREVWRESPDAPSIEERLENFKAVKESLGDLALKVLRETLPSDRFSLVYKLMTPMNVETLRTLIVDHRSWFKRVIEQVPGAIELALQINAGDIPLFKQRTDDYMEYVAYHKKIHDGGFFIKYSMRSGKPMSAIEAERDYVTSYLKDSSVIKTLTSLNGNDVTRGFENFLFIKKHVSSVSVYAEENNDNLIALKEALAVANDQSTLALLKIKLAAIAPSYKVKAIDRVLGQIIKDTVIDFSKEADVVFLKKFIQRFGLMSSGKLFNEAHALGEGAEPSADLRELGVTDSGNKGIAQLQNVVRDVGKQFVLSPTFSVDISNSVVVDVLRDVSNYDMSEWKRDKSFTGLVEQFKREQAEGLIVALPEEYTNERMAVAKVQTAFNFSEGSVKRFQQLVNDFTEADSRPDTLLTFRAFQEEVLQSVFAFNRDFTLRLKQVAYRNEGADAEKIARIEAAIEMQLQQMDVFGQAVEATKTISDLLATIVNFEIKTSNKRVKKMAAQFSKQLVFYQAIQENPEAVVSVREMSNELEPSQDSFERMIEFIENVVKQETYKALRLDKKQRKHLSRNITAKALQEDLQRASVHATGTFTEFAVVPSRDILAELSGYYGNACWTRQDMIMKNNPSMLGVAFVMNPDSPKDQRLAGSSLLIETTVQGEKVLIIRGLNPQQNVITTLPADEFFEKFVSVLEQWAKKRGIMKILTPRDNEGAQSNRPALNTYIADKYKEEKVVTLDEENSFNGYDITRSCVVVRTVTEE